MSLMKNLLIDLLNDEKSYFYDLHPKFYFPNSYKNVQKLTDDSLTNQDGRLKIDLPYLDLTKLTSYVENGYLFIKYDNPDDIRRKSYEYVVYVGEDEVRITYENGFLIIEREIKKPERKFIKVN